MKLTTYKGINITVDEISGKFKADIAQSAYEDTFEKIRGFIDRYTEIKPLNIPIIKIPYVHREPYCIVSGKITKLPSTDIEINPLSFLLLYLKLFRKSLSAPSKNKTVPKQLG